MDSCLLYLLKYVCDKTFDRLIKLTKGKTSSQIKTIHVGEQGVCRWLRNPWHKMVQVYGRRNRNQGKTYTKWSSCSQNVRMQTAYWNDRFVQTLAFTHSVACTAGIPVRGEQKATAGEGGWLKNVEGEGKGSEGSLPSSPSPSPVAAFCSPERERLQYKLHILLPSLSPTKNTLQAHSPFEPGHNWVLWSQPCRVTDKPHKDEENPEVNKIM